MASLTPRPFTPGGGEEPPVLIGWGSEQKRKFLIVLELESPPPVDQSVASRYTD
jgi:hypothetical protein